MQPSSFEHLHARYDNAKILYDAGVQFAFRSASNHDARRLPSEVAVAVAHGLPFEAVFRLCVSTPRNCLRCMNPMSLEKVKRRLPIFSFAMGSLAA